MLRQKSGTHFGICALVALAVVLGGVEADAKKRARRAKRKGKKAAVTKQVAKKKEERKSAARFDWTSRSSQEGMDSRADKKRDEAILKLKRLMPTIPKGPQKAELIFRLSEMYWSKSKFKKLVAMQTWDKALEEWHGSGEKGKEPKLEKIAEYDESSLYKREALKLYNEILKSYPTYGRKDEVLYNLGHSLYEAGKKKEGVKRYWELIKQYKDKSDFTADAWLELGEHFFNANKVTNAVKAYTQAAKTSKSRIYSYALYKLAWCDYNLGEYETALKKFGKVVEYAKSKKKKRGKGAFGSNDRIQLVDEALSDMVRTYSHLDAVDDAFEYYEAQVGKEKSYKYLQKLAALYNTEGKDELEIQTYRELNGRFPYAPDAPSNQSAIMNAFARMEKRDKVRKEVRRLVDLYSPNGTWATKNAGNQTVLTEAFEQVEEQLAGLVTEQHKEAQDTKLSATYKLARDIYKEYLDKFTKTENSYRFRFFYSEILFELKEFDKAAEQYDLVVTENKKGEFARHAAYASILSWEKVAAGVTEKVGKKISEGKKGKAKGRLKKLEQLQKLTKGKSYDETPLKPVERKLADACDQFVEVSPKDEEVVKVKFKSARLYYIHNQFEEAAKRFGEIIDRWPKDRLARISAESIVESFNVREDWSNLNQWARKFSGNKRLMGDRSFAKTINEFVEGSSFNEILFVFEPKSKPGEIADYYTSFVKEFPKSKYALIGLYNAVINYDKANRLEDSIARGNKILKDYKDFKFKEEDLTKSKREGNSLPDPLDIREKVLFMAGSFAERLAEFEKAAGLYEQYLKEFKKGPKRSDALFNAALLREGLGQYDEAINNFKSYVKEFKTAKDVPVITWRIGTILEKKKDDRAVQRHFSEYSAKFGKKDPSRRLCADYKVTKALESQKKKREADAAYARILKDYAKLSQADRLKDCPLLAAGNASFLAIEPSYDKYRAIKLAGVGERQMTKNLLAKLEQVEILQQDYTKLLQLGQGDYGIASLYRIGQVYQQLAQQIFDTRCPKRLTEDQCMIYEAALQEKAFPLEEKAIEAYDKALQKAYELGLYNDWLAKAQEALKVYEPGRFPEIRTYDLIAGEAVFEAAKLMAWEN